MQRLSTTAESRMACEIGSDANMLRKATGHTENELSKICPILTVRCRRCAKSGEAYPDGVPFSGYNPCNFCSPTG